MKSEMSFREIEEVQKEILSKQPSFSLEMAIEQVQKLKNQNTSIKENEIKKLILFSELNKF